MNSILNKVKESTAYVGMNSDFVKINYSKVDELVENIELDKINFWLNTNPFNILDLDLNDIIKFLFVYHAIGDYCFWGEPKWTIKTECGDLDGSYAVMYLITKRLKNKLDFNMSFEEFKTFLKGNIEMPLLMDRYNNLTKMNKFLLEQGGDFYSLIKDIYNDEQLLEYIMTNFDYYNDESEYKGKTIYFYKRLQLLTSDILHVREKFEKGPFNYSHLLGCADYKIPQVMRCNGLLEFNEELSNLVDNKIELKEGSPMEVEIRAAEIVIIDYITNKLDNKVTRMDINDYIWLLGQDKTKMIKLYHRTLTNHY